ncbi:MAG: GAF domain-containing protein [Reyranella sp.]|uniref:GAF domain-containing protein n=1 Tax=Reyranella sp. TaxID=1929291 RepID=UPI001AD37C53|nr:GAF domain-containing protein [Reyranella sp.]MBN9085565.1 GAF domain-containing protein [Reyranella sp.]
MTRDALERELALARAERDQALEQQAALAEVLRAINASSADFRPVFDLIIGKAMALCDAAFGTLLSYENDRLSMLAQLNGPAPLVAFWQTPQPPHPGSTTARALAAGKSAQTLDLARSESYLVERLPMTVASVELGGIRTILQVPLMSEAEPIGVFILYRQEVRPFTEAQIALVEAFAGHAALTMGNARLMSEQREALEQQTATADILRVISQSPTDIAPVMTAVAKAAVGFCGAEDAHVFLRDGDEMVSSAHEGPLSAHPLGYRDALDARNTARAQTIVEARITHIPDTLAPNAEAAYRSIRENSIQHGFRAQLNAPMLKDGRAIGCICLRRRDAGAFTSRQIALLETFAAQAAIAIENVRLFTELREALERQTATAEVLQVINTSPGSLEPVFGAMLEKAMHLCEAAFGIFGRFDGQLFEPAADLGVPAELIATTRQIQSPPPNSGLGRLAAGESVVQLVDLANTDVYRSGFVGATALVDIGGAKTAIFVALRKDGRLIGVIVMYRREVRAFSDKQVALLQDFAAQAVIAMENARLLTEQREALEQQTATAEILRAISQSPTDVQPVLDVVVKAAQRFCGATDAVITLRQGNHYMHTAHEGNLTAALGVARPLDRTNSIGRAILDGSTIHLPDMDMLDPAEWGAARELAATHGFKAAIATPMMREGVAIGGVLLRKPEPGPFAARQIALLEAFAAQAVIALSNVRLFTELRESLDYQTATSEVLEVISRSTSDLTPVLNAILAAAARLFGVEKGDVSIRRDGQIRYAASIGTSPAEDAWLRTRIIAPDRSTCAGRAMVTQQAVHVLDQSADPELAVPRQISAHQTVLSVPLLREGEVIGVITVLRDHVEAFTDRQIALIKTFADQAVIAIENARLLGELRERQSELRVTFDNMGDAVVMFDAHRRLAAWNRNFQEMLDVSDAFLAERPTLDDYVRLLIERGEVGPVVDVEAEMARFRARFDQQWSAERTRPNGRILEVRNNPVPDGGAVLIYGDVTERKKAEANIRAARDAAEAALLQLKAAQANLVQSEKMASLGQLTAGIAHEIKNPLNFVNNFASLSVELLDELKEIAGPALETLDQDKRAELGETMGLLTGNLGKIAEHGKRADGIVRSMLSHSRGGSGDWQASDINALVEEALNLAYHGARAQDKEFNVTLERDFEAAGKPIEVVPQDVTRVFLNLFGNGFYAANKRRLAREAGFRPAIKVSTRDLGDRVEVRVRDNGIGIPAEVRDKLFQPFFTTKPTGEGTGLGLSISYDIVTQQHGGSIEVESEVGRFTEFTVRLPRIPRVASAKRA